MQVRHAEAAGAAAAIVFDDAYEPLIIMSKPAGHASPDIPSVFVSQKSGIIMKKLMTPGVTVAHIMPVRYSASHVHVASLQWSVCSVLDNCVQLFSCKTAASASGTHVLLLQHHSHQQNSASQISDEVWISILMSAFSGVIAVGVMLATFYFIRRHRLRALGARGGLTEALLGGEVCMLRIA